MKSCPSNMLLRCTIYLTSANRRQSKMFKTNLPKKPHEIRFFIYGPDDDDDDDDDDDLFLWYG